MKKEKYSFSKGKTRDISTDGMDSLPVISSHENASLKRWSVNSGKKWELPLLSIISHWFICLIGEARIEPILTVTSESIPMKEHYRMLNQRNQSESSGLTRKNDEIFRISMHSKPSNEESLFLKLLRSKIGSSSSYFMMTEYKKRHTVPLCGISIFLHNTSYFLISPLCLLSLLIAILVMPKRKQSKKISILCYRMNTILRFWND